MDLVVCLDGVGELALWIDRSRRDETRRDETRQPQARKSRTDSTLERTLVEKLLVPDEPIARLADDEPRVVDDIVPEPIPEPPKEPIPETHVRWPSANVGVRIPALGDARHLDRVRDGIERGFVQKGGAGGRRRGVGSKKGDAGGNSRGGGGRRTSSGKEGRGSEGGSTARAEEGGGHGELLSTGGVNEPRDL